MIGFFKAFGKGIFYVLVLPILIIILSIYAVFGLFAMIYYLFKSFFLMFKHQSIFKDLPEDIEAKRRLGKLPKEEEKKKDEPLKKPAKTGEDIPPVFTTFVGPVPDASTPSVGSINPSSTTASTPIVSEVKPHEEIIKPYEGEITSEDDIEPPLPEPEEVKDESKKTVEVTPSFLDEPDEIKKPSVDEILGSDLPGFEEVADPDPLKDFIEEDQEEVPSKTIEIKPDDQPSDLSDIETIDTYSSGSSNDFILEDEDIEEDKESGVDIFYDDGRDD